MEKGIPQCGFTRLGTQGTAAGWQAFKLNELVKVSALDEYSSLQTQNIPTRPLVDKEGNPEYSYEIICNEKNIYVSRIQYGLKDGLGRQNNIFAHAYIFDCSDDEAIKNPNSFLGIDSSSFLEELPDNNVSDKNYYSANRFTISSAMTELGIDSETYKSMVYALFASIQQKKPLIIKVEDAKGMIWPLSYLLLMALPFKMRKRFSCTTLRANMNLDRTIILADKVSSIDNYFDLSNGTNNVVDERLIRKYKRAGYPDFASSSLNDEEIVNYFEELQKVDILLGDTTGRYSQALKIAHQIINLNDNDEISNIDLQLYEALNFDIESDLLIEYIEELLASSIEERIILSPELEKQISEHFCPDDIVGGLDDVLLKYIVMSITNKPILEGIAMLKGFPREKRKNIICDIVKEDNGSEYILEYYKSIVEEINSFTDLSDYYEQYKSYVSPDIRVCDVFESRAYELYCNGIDKFNVIDSIDEYMAFMSECNSGNALNEIEIAAKNYYWDNINLEDFDYELNERYNAMYSSSIPRSMQFDLLSKVYEGLFKKDNEVLKKAYAEFLDITGSDFNDDKKAQLWSSMEKAARERSISFELLDIEIFGLLISCGWLDIEESIRDIFLLIKRNDLEALKVKYTELCETYLKSQEKIEKCNYVINEGYCLALNVSYIPIDSVLTIGECIFDHAMFRILNTEFWNYDCLEKYEEEEMLDDSVLFSEQKYVDLARIYVKSKGLLSNNVKRWISYIKKNKNIAPLSPITEKKKFIEGFSRKSIKGSADNEIDGSWSSIKTIGNNTEADTCSDEKESVDNKRELPKTGYSGSGYSAFVEKKSVPPVSFNREQIAKDTLELDYQNKDRTESDNVETEAMQEEHEVKLREVKKSKGLFGKLLK